MWVKDEEFPNHYLYKLELEGATYIISILVPYTDNLSNIRYYVGVSSGTKRYEFDIFTDKKNKTKGSLSNLHKVYDVIMSFDKWFMDTYFISDTVSRYYCIEWSDTRRKRIYQRLLESKGWRITNFEGTYSLTKKIK